MERSIWCLVKVSVSEEGTVSLESGDDKGVLARRTLQDLEVLDVGVFSVDIELDAGHGHIEKDAVVDLAKGRAVFLR